MISISNIKSSRMAFAAAAFLSLSQVAVAQAPAQPFEGEHRGLIILVEFGAKPLAGISEVLFSDPTGEASTDDDVRKANVRSFYERVANEEGFSDETTGFTQSVCDYFLAQSRGAFKFKFDVMGPYKLRNPYTYYGADNGSTIDVNLCNLIQDACTYAQRVDSIADPSVYDWDADGYADQVFILYAGQGQNTNGENTSLIWPQEGNLSGVGSSVAPFTLGDESKAVKVDTYACSCELGEGGKRDGIGTICHEFSHCLGLPDAYDKGTSFGATSLNYGTYVWDPMNMGNYLGDSFSPAGYTALERWLCGWLTPIELSTDNETAVLNLKPLSEGGDAYVIRNPAYTDEFYMIENRAKTGTDTALYASGLLITHVDYSEEAWQANNVNTTKERCAVVAADNSWLRTVDDVIGDLYPYVKDGAVANNTLSNVSTPACTTIHPNTDGSYFLNVKVTDMEINADGSANFVCSADATKPTVISEPKIEAEQSVEAYSLDGRKISTNGAQLGRGLYIVGGKLKMIK